MYYLHKSLSNRLNQSLYHFWFVECHQRPLRVNCVPLDPREPPSESSGSQVIHMIFAIAIETLGIHLSLLNDLRGISLFGLVPLNAPENLKDY